MTSFEQQALAQALRIRAQADEWPRCGQGWPQTPAEEQAAYILDAAGNPATLPPTDEQRAAIDDFNVRDGTLKAARDVAYTALRAARRTRDSRSIRTAEAAYRAAQAAVDSNITAYGRAMGVI